MVSAQNILTRENEDLKTQIVEQTIKHQKDSLVLEIKDQVKQITTLEIRNSDLKIKQ